MDIKTIVIGLVIGLLVGAGASYGAISSQTSTLQNQIVMLQSQITTISADKTSLQGQVITFQGQVTLLQGQLTTKTNEVTTLNDQLTAAQTQITTKDSQMAALAISKNSEISTLTADKVALQEQLTSAQIQIAARDSQIVALQKLVPISKFLSTSLYPAVQIGSYVYQLGFYLSNNSPWTITVTGVEFFDKGILWHTISTNDIKEIWGTGNVEAGKSFSGHLSFQLPHPIEEINGWQITWHCLDGDGVKFDVTGP